MSANPITLVTTGLKSRRELLWLKEGKKCHWCGCPTRMVTGEDWDQATIEHIIPRSRGGTNDPDNLTSACRRCNSRRNHEVMLGLPDGHLLGKFKIGPSASTPMKHVALTKDEKKAITSKSSNLEMMRNQRDQALKEIITLREQLGIAQSDNHWQRILLKDKEAEIAMLKKEIPGPTIWTSLRRKLAAWIAPPDKQ